LKSEPTNYSLIIIDRDKPGPSNFMTQTICVEDMSVNLDKSDFANALPPHEDLPVE
jgi:hypothetical protein